MDAFRYGLTVLLVCTALPFLFYWPVVHGLIGFWRRRGPVVTFVCTLGGMFLGALLLFRLRTVLVQGDLGTRLDTTAVGVALIVTAGWLRGRIQKELPMKVLVGIPELAVESNPQELVSAGIFGRIQHPRYVQFFVALGGWAFIANHFSAYAVWLLWIPGVYVTVLFEERELTERFGEAYQRYRRDVPRFLPRLL